MIKKQTITAAEDYQEEDIYYDEKKCTGYTVDGGEVVAWDDEKHDEKNFIRYFSDPFSLSTTGDPYNDFDKVLRKIDGGILEEAHHPLVAACPEVGVELEKLILSKVQNISIQKGQSQTNQNANTMTVSTSNNHNDGNHLSVGGSVGASVLGPKITVSVNLSHNWSTAITTGKVDSKTTTSVNTDTWTDTLGINRAETAWLNANVRYINTGTAPIYDCMPTLNFVIGSGKEAQTVSTVGAKANTVANIILPNDSYPKKHQNPIAFNTNDDFNSHPIMLNYEQVEQLDKGKKLIVETLQTFSKYAQADIKSLELRFDDKRAWSNVMNNIYNRTACITITFGENYTFKRRVAARKLKDYDKQEQPELTIKEAIEIAFPHIAIDMSNNFLIYKNKAAHQDHYFETFHHEPICLVDEFSNTQIENQKKKYEKYSNKKFNSFDTKLVQGMNLIFIAQHSDKELLEIIEKYLKDFTKDHAFDLKNIDPNNQWTVVLAELKKLILNKFGEVSFKRIKTIKIEKETEAILKNVTEQGTNTNRIWLQIGDIWTDWITINFMNVMSDQQLFNTVKSVLEKFDDKNRFNLINELDIEKTWSHVVDDIKEVLMHQFGNIGSSRITNIQFENDLQKIGDNANDLGQDHRLVRFSVGSIDSDWITMFFKNINIEKIPDKIELNYEVWPAFISVSGSVWGRYSLKEKSSEEIRILEIKKYRQKNLEKFINKYPIIDFQFNSFITNPQNLKVAIVEKKQFETAELFKINQKSTTTRISDFYQGPKESGYITGGNQAYTELITYYRDDGLYIKTSAHAGGGGNSSNRSVQAQIKIESIVFRN